MGRSYADIKYDFWYNLKNMGISPDRILLVSKAMPGSTKQDFSNQKLNIANNGTILKNGVLQFNGFNNYLQASTASPELPVTIVVGFSTNNILTPSCVAGYFNSTVGGDPRFAIALNESTPGKLNLFLQAASIVRVEAPGNLIAGMPHVGAVVVESGSSYAYLDGKESLELTSTFSLSSGIDVFSIGRFGDSSPNLYYNGAQSFQLAVAGRLTASQIAQIDAKTLFKPRPDISYFDQTTQGSLLPINHQSIGLTEYPISVSYGQEIPLESQSIGLTEYPISSSIGESVELSIQSVGLTEYPMDTSIGGGFLLSLQNIGLTQYPISIQGGASIPLMLQTIGLTEYPLAGVQIGGSASLGIQSIGITEYPISSTIGGGIDVDLEHQSIGLTEYPISVSYGQEIPLGYQAIGLTQYATRSISTQIFGLITGLINISEPSGKIGIEEPYGKIGIEEPRARITIK